MPATDTISDRDRAAGEPRSAPAAATCADRSGQAGAGGTLPGSMTIPGHARHVAEARAFTARTLGGHPVSIPDAVLLVSELATNSIQHSRSGSEDGAITITLTATDGGGIRAEVTDAGGTGVPALRQDQADQPELMEAGQGLRLVDKLSARWGYRRAEAGLVTWFELDQAQP